RDPLDALESAAARGDGTALESLASMAARTVDASVHRAWSRATLAATEWRVVDGESALDPWRALVIARRGEECGGEADVRLPKVGGGGVVVDAPGWRGVRVVELVAAAPCDGGAPMVLEVDGEQLAATPATGTSRWHVRVSGDRAHVRRLDHGRGQVYAIPR